jgi:hypothetical protein
VLKEYDRDSPTGLYSLTDSILRQTFKGMRTSLHRYQRRSVARMVQQELDPGACPDPLYIPIQGLDGRAFYLQPATMEVLCDQPMMSQVRGGILCEELGEWWMIIRKNLIDEWCHRLWQDCHDTGSDFSDC